MMFIFSAKRNGVQPITAKRADKDYRDTDAGTDRIFIVQAPDRDLALTGARAWLAARADDEDDLMPEGVHLEERERRPGKTYMTLRVL